MEMNLDGITVKLEIRGYTKYDRESEEEPRWCRLDFSFISQPWLRYKRQDDEVLTNEEVEALAEHLERLLNGRMAEPTELECIEPDFCFIFSCFDIEGKLSWPPMADLHISFWDDGLTANYLSLCFGKTNLDALWQYLRLVTGEADLSDPRVRFWLDKGAILPEYEA